MGSARKRILLLDDSPIVHDVIGDALVEAGLEVASAQNLDELEQCRASGTFDLVLMDVQMPEAFGDDVAMVLRSVRGVETPIYLLSGLADEELEQRAADAEIDGFISKKLSPAEIVRRVQRILEGGPRPA